MNTMLGKKSSNLDEPILSLCIPTNGVIEWVFPVLDSIYNNVEDLSKFEVVIENNGDNKEFERELCNYQTKYQNIKYHKSTAEGFLCQIDCFKHAQGQFIKFVNHRSLLEEGTLKYLIEFAENNKNKKPVVYFSNGYLKDLNCQSFNSFVSGLEYWSSWSGGLAFWKEDIDLLLKKKKYNSLFPHTDVLFIKRNCSNYLIDSKKIFSEIQAGHSLKGKYNLFKAFADEYLSIINDLLREEAITVETFLSVKKSLRSFLAGCYIDFIILKKPASYYFDNAWKYLNIYYSLHQVVFSIFIKIFSRVIRKIVRVFC